MPLEKEPAAERRRKGSRSLDPPSSRFPVLLDLAGAVELATYIFKGMLKQSSRIFGQFCAARQREMALKHSGKE